MIFAADEGSESGNDEGNVNGICGEANDVENEDIHPNIGVEGNEVENEDIHLNRGGEGNDIQNNMNESKYSS